MVEKIWKKITQEEFDKILDLHDLWVRTDQREGEQADFRGCDLRNIKFRQRANLAGADLEGSNLEGAILIEADFKGANLEEVNLEQVFFIGINFELANLTGSNFEGAYLIEVNLQVANLAGANLEGATLVGGTFTGANLAGANLAEITLNSLDINEINLSAARNVPIQYLNPINMEWEAVYLQTRIQELENQLAHADSQGNQADEVAKLKKQLENLQQKQNSVEELQKKLDEANKKLDDKLNRNIANAIEQLEKALKNTDNQIFWNKWTGLFCWLAAIALVGFDVFLLVYVPYQLIFGTDLSSRLVEVKNIFGSFSLLIFSFPVLIILFIVIHLFRHQKQLMAELRHYSMLKHKIELYGGILKAARYTAASVIELKNSNNQQSAEYIQTVFDEIKKELLKSPNFDLNTQPHIFAEEGNQIMEMFKSSTDLAKAATEISRNALNSVSKVGSEK